MVFVIEAWDQWSRVDNNATRSNYPLPTGFLVQHLDDRGVGRKYRPRDLILGQCALQFRAVWTDKPPVADQKRVAVEIGSAVDERPDPVENQRAAETIVIKHRLRPQR